MRRFLVAAFLAAVMVAIVPAAADGPSGSSEHVEQDGRTVYTNDVSCDGGTATPVAVLYAGANGAEVCNEGGPVPLQGRIIVTSDDGGYIAADGDEDNGAEQARGWIRIDGDGVRCGDSGGRLDATHPTSADTQDDCG